MLKTFIVKKYSPPYVTNTKLREVEKYLTVDTYKSLQKKFQKTVTIYIFCLNHKV